MVEIDYQSVSNEDSTDVSFSLSCNSQFGEPGNRAVWTRDGVLLDNISSLDLVNASTSSYTNVLIVHGRTPGTYTCQIRAPDDQLLNSANFIVQGMYYNQLYFSKYQSACAKFDEKLTIKHSYSRFCEIPNLTFRKPSVPIL